MKIWIDADSCPAAVRVIIANASRRLAVEACFVANRPLRLPRGDTIAMVCVTDADAHILACARPADLVVTRDIPLAARLIDKGVGVLNERGTVYDRGTIGPRLALRNARIDAPAAPPASRSSRVQRARATQSFAASLDRELTKRLRIASIDDRIADRDKV